MRNTAMTNERTTPAIAGICLLALAAVAVAQLLGVSVPGLTHEPGRLVMGVLLTGGFGSVALWHAFKR